jgi:hypothetical protein
MSDQPGTSNQLDTDFRQLRSRKIKLRKRSRSASSPVISQLFSKAARCADSDSESVSGVANLRDLISHYKPNLPANVYRSSSLSNVSAVVSPSIAVRAVESVVLDPQHSTPIEGDKSPPALRSDSAASSVHAGNALQSAGSILLRTAKPCLVSARNNSTSSSHALSGGEADESSDDSESRVDTSVRRADDEFVPSSVIAARQLLNNFCKQHVETINAGRYVLHEPVVDIVVAHTHSSNSFVDNADISDPNWDFWDDFDNNWPIAGKLLAGCSKDVGFVPSAFQPYKSAGLELKKQLVSESEDDTCFAKAAVSRVNTVAPVAGGKDVFTVNRPLVVDSAPEYCASEKVEPHTAWRVHKSFSLTSEHTDHSAVCNWTSLQEHAYQKYILAQQPLLFSEEQHSLPQYPYQPPIKFDDNQLPGVDIGARSSTSPISPIAGTNILQPENKYSVPANVQNAQFKQASPLQLEIPSVPVAPLNFSFRPISPALVHHKSRQFRKLKVDGLKQANQPVSDILQIPARRQIKVDLSLAHSPINTSLVVKKDEAVNKTDSELSLPVVVNTSISSMAAVDAADVNKVVRPVISDSIIAPKTFSNATDSDPEVWLNYFLKFVDFKKLNESDTKGLFAMLLHGPASDWFSTLNLPSGTSFATILEKFKANYYPSVELKWREMANVWNTKQGDSESVNVFLTRLKVLSRRSKITEESLHYAFLNGLKPQIRLHCLQNGVTSLENTLRSALVAEVSGISDPMSSLILDSLKQNSVAAEQQLLQMQALSDKVNALTISAASQSPTAIPTHTLSSAAVESSPTRASSESKQTDRRPVQSQYDRRSNFQPPVARGFNIRTPRFNPQREQRERYSRMHAERFAPQPVTQQRAQVPPQRQDVPGVGQGQGQECGWCGLIHGREARCNASTAVCYACGKQGHFSRVCRSARRMQ